MKRIVLGLCLALLSLSLLGQETVSVTDRSRVVWDDLKAPFTQAKQGQLDKPDFDFTNIGLLFPQNDNSEAVYIIVQLPHEYKLGTDIRPHIHWQQSAATAVTWTMEYKWFDNGEAVPGAFTTTTTSKGVFEYTSGDMLQISSFPMIDGSSITGVSSILLIKLYRDDNTTSGDVLAFEFDVHYQIDALGSRQEFVK